MTPGRVDRLWAGAAGAVALAVYVRTLAPGLTADIDTAMFQFVGRVLGVPHNPGYPLYVLVTHAFSYLPIGSLAYRINLFSALCGAVTVSLAFGLARQLGCRRLVAAAGALGVAFGPVFWSQSLIAEVYTLDAAIVAGMWACLLGWARTRRDGWYFAAVGLFAAGLGNHTTIVGCAPGAVLYVLLVDRRFALRARTMAITAVLLAAGVLQYAFILVRSHQPGAYLESKAATVADLLGVMTGRQFADRLFAFGWHTVLFERIPWMVTDVFVPEVTLPGLLLAGAGGLWLLRRRLPDALLLSTGAAAVVGFGLNYAVVDTPVFLIPALLVLWLAAAVGLERLATLAERRRWALASVCAAAMLLPAWQLSRNFRAVDRSRDTRDATHLARLFEALPARAALVSEDFTVDRMLQFKLLGEGAARGRDISIVPRTASAVRDRLNGGARVFAFGKAADVLRRDALDVSFAPLTLVEGPLGAYLTRLEDGCTVAVAVPGRYASAFAAAAGVSLVAIGGPHKLGVMSPSSNVVVTGVRRGWDDARVTQAASDLHLALPLRAGPRSSAALAAPAEAWSSSAAAAIRQGGRDLVRSSQGAVMATWRPDGRLADVFVLPSENGFQVPLPTDALSVYPVRGTLEGQALVPGWTDLAPLTRTGIVLVRLAGGAQVEMHVDGAGPLAPRVIDRSSANRTRR